MPFHRARRAWADTSPWQRWAVTCWVVLLLSVCGRLIFASPRTHTVYPIFANAARNWQAGEGMYGKLDGLDYFRYSPAVAAFFVPWTALSDRAGNVLWVLLNAAAFLGGLAWWLRAVALVPADRRAAVYLLVLPLALISLNNGQSNALILGLLLAATAAAASGRWALCAACVAAATLFKVYPLAVGLLLVACYPRPLTGRLAVALVVGLALPFLFRPPGYVVEQYLGWVQHLRGSDRSAWPLYTCPRDLQMLFRVWLVPLSPAVNQAVQFAAATGFAAVCLAARRAGWPTPRLLVLVVGLGCCWMTLLGPATESSTYTLLAPSLAVALVGAWRELAPLWERAALAASFGLFVVTLLVGMFPDSWRFKSLGPQPFAALLLLAVLLAGAWRGLARPAPAGAPSPA